MIGRMFRTMGEEDGGTATDYAVVLALVAVAGIIWFIQLGGEDGLAEVMVNLSWATRRFLGIVP